MSLRPWTVEFTPQNDGSQNRFRLWYPMCIGERKLRWKPMKSAVEPRT